MSDQPKDGELVAPRTPPGSGSRSTDETVAASTPLRSGSGSAGVHYVDYLSERPGTIIGRYKLLEEIGHGGFGVVYMAEQEVPVRRKVAMKIIKLGMDTREVITRFEAERQALAMMDHPHIAKVFDAGATETGRPYFVMELVQGMPITEYCDQANLSVRDRLNLFTEVCSAVQHAHQKGVIHRDLKPNNILVAMQDGTPSPKVIDFGIAKATEQKLTERTMHTGHGQFMGTPAYMSPEQAEKSGLDVDTRSDIYSLGVVLYELLTGSTPFDIKTTQGTALDEVRRMIRERDPAKPSTKLSAAGEQLTHLAQRRGVEPKRLGTLLRGDLDWIVMKALEKDRARRYETANGFGMDIQRYLRGEAVVAAPPSAAYRFRKFVRRHKGVVTAGTMVAAALLLGVVAFAWQARVAREQRDIAISAQQAEAEERTIADEQRDRARTEAAKAEKTTQFLTSIFGGIDPYTSLGMDTTLLKKILGDVEERISKELADQPEVEAAIRETLGWAYISLGQYPTAESQFATARRLVKSADGESTRQTLKIETAEATLLDRMGRHAESEALHKATLSKMRKVLGDNDSDTLDVMSRLGMIQMRIGKFRDSEQTLRAVLDKQTRLLGDSHPRTLRTMMSLAETLHQVSNYAEAEKFAKLLVERRKETLGPDDVAVYEAQSTWAAAMKGLRRYAEAEQLETSTVEKLNQTLGPDNPQTLNVRNNLAFTLRMLDRIDEAEDIYRDTLERRRRVLGNENAQTLSSVANLGTFLYELGRHEEAELLIREGLEGRLRLLGDEHVDTRMSMLRMAVLHKNKRELREAGELLGHIAAVDRKTRSENDAQVGMSLYNWAAMLQDQQNHEAAEPIFREVITLHEKYTRRDEPYVAASFNGVARSLDAKKEFATADEFYRKGLEMRRRLYVKPDRDLAYSLNDFGAALLDRGDFAAAEPLLRENLAVVQATLPDTAWQIGEAMSGLGATLAGLSRFEEAEPLVLEGYDRLKKNTEPKPDVIPPARARVVDLYEAWHAAAPNDGKDETLARWERLNPDEPPTAARPADAVLPTVD